MDMCQVRSQGRAWRALQWLLLSLLPGGRRLQMDTLLRYRVMDLLQAHDEGPQDGAPPLQRRWEPEPHVSQCLINCLLESGCLPSREIGSVCFL